MGELYLFYTLHTTTALSYVFVITKVVHQTIADTKVGNFEVGFLLAVTFYVRKVSVEI